VDTSPAAFARHPNDRRWIWLSIVLLVLGLLGHLLAARAIGGSRMAYTHHIFGFVVILVVTGALIALLGWRVWRGRRIMMLLSIAAVQAVFGFLIYLMRFHVM
jgi:hypothetical protein